MAVRAGGGATKHDKGGGRDVLAEYRDTLYGKRQDYDGMVLTANAMVSNAKAKINVLVLRSDGLQGVLRSWTPRRYELAMKKLGGKTVLDLRKRNGEQDPVTHGLRIAIAEMPDRPGYYCAVSDCRSAEFTGIFMTFISRHSPDISRLFLTNGDMAGVLGGIESQGYDVDVKYGSTRGRGQYSGDPEQGTGRAAGSIAAFFAKLDDDARAATTVRYVARPNGRGGRGSRAEWRGTITRDCRFSASADAEILFRTAIPRALSLPLKRNRLIEASAESAGSDEVEPTVIRFGRKIFVDKDKNERHVDVIARMPDSSISKYHVNPHIHLSLVDYMDGSSYDIWVVTSDRLVIIPQIRASGASLKRLVNHIFEHMGEGRVEKYEH